jgi:hypothetical protein
MIIKTIFFSVTRQNKSISRPIASADSYGAVMCDAKNAPKVGSNTIVHKGGTGISDVNCDIAPVTILFVDVVSAAMIQHHRR